MKQLKPYLKALAGGLTSLVAAGAQAATDDVYSQSELWIMAGAFLAGLGVVWAVPNKPKAAGYRPEHGA